MNCPYCNKPIETHESLEELEHLNRLFAEKVMGWKKKFCDYYLAYRWFDSNGKSMFGTYQYHPSTNIAQAMEGVEKVKWISITKTPHNPIWSCEIRTWRDLKPVWSFLMCAENPPLAITRALVIWAMESQK